MSILLYYLDENPATAKEIVGKALLAAHLPAKLLVLRAITLFAKVRLTDLVYRVKLADCSSKNWPSQKSIS